MAACRSLKPEWRILEPTCVWLRIQQALRWGKPNSECRVRHTLAVMKIKMSVGICLTNVQNFTFLVVPPVITSDIKAYTVALDASVTLQCHSEGFPTPSITWYKNGQLLSESVRQRVLSTGALQIAFAQPGDTGRYTCTAANVAGTTSLEMSLTVQSESRG